MSHRSVLTWNKKQKNPCVKTKVPQININNHRSTINLDSPHKREGKTNEEKKKRRIRAEKKCERAKKGRVYRQHSRTCGSIRRDCGQKRLREVIKRVRARLKKREREREISSSTETDAFHVISHPLFARLNLARTRSISSPPQRLMTKR